MAEKSKSLRHGNLLICLILVAITLLVYLPGMNRLGYYRDDWNNVFNAYTQGSQMLIRHYQSDRPVDGYLLSAAYDLFGPNPYPYLLINLACRFFCGFFFYLTLTLIWKKNKFPAFVAASLFLVFPGFLRQVDGIAYLPHQTAMLAGMLSVYLTILSLELRKSRLKIPAVLLSIILAILEMFLMEYYIGLEALRILLIGAYFYNSADDRFSRIAGKTILNYLPWLVGALIFFLWRSFLFEATRSGADVQDTLRPFFEHPRYYGMDWVAKILKNTFKLLFGSWIIPAYNLLSQLEVKRFWKIFAYSLLPAAIFIIGFIRLMPERKEKISAESSSSKNKKAGWRQQWIVIGLVSTVLAIAPMIIANREITFSSSLDRFTYHASFSAIIFLVGLIASIEGKWVKTALFAVLILAACMTQITNKENYIAQTDVVNDFWWQLSWRAPDISPGTLVLLSMDGFSAEEDYELFVPLHLIYHPDEDHVVIGSDLLNQDSAKKADMKKIEDRIVREIYLRKDYSQILALTKPTVKSCLQVIDGRNPIYTPAQWSRISEIGSYSQIDKILTDADPHVPSSEFFGKEPDKNWCYFYEKMSLAQQSEDWEKVAEIAGEALSAGAHGEDPLEWLPLVQAYAYLGRYSDAKPYGEILKTDEYLKFETCRYFRIAAGILNDPSPAKKALPWLENEFCK